MNIRPEAVVEAATGTHSQPAAVDMGTRNHPATVAIGTGTRPGAAGAAAAR
jgi:hypothetical protein